jgi:hypothetical protein
LKVKGLSELAMPVTLFKKFSVVKYLRYCSTSVANLSNNESSWQISRDGIPGKSAKVKRKSFAKCLPNPLKAPNELDSSSLMMGRRGSGGKDGSNGDSSRLSGL